MTTPTEDPTTRTVPIPAQPAAAVVPHQRGPVTAAPMMPPAAATVMPLRLADGVDRDGLSGWGLHLDGSVLPCLAQR